LICELMLVMVALTATTVVPQILLPPVTLGQITNCQVGWKIGGMKFTSVTVTDMAPPPFTVQVGFCGTTEWSSLR
jgi:hypothetical protein